MNETLIAPARYFCYSKQKQSSNLDVETEQPKSLDEYDDYISYFDSLFTEQIIERESGDDIREFLAYHLNYFMGSVGGDRKDFVHHLNEKIVQKLNLSIPTRHVKQCWCGCF